MKPVRYLLWNECWDSSVNKISSKTTQKFIGIMDHEIYFKIYLVINVQIERNVFDSCFDDDKI